MEREQIINNKGKGKLGFPLSLQPPALSLSPKGAADSLSLSSIGPVMDWAGYGHPQYEL